MGTLSCGLSIPGVYERDGRYYRVIKNTWHRLSRIDEGITALHKALYELMENLPSTSTPQTLADVMKLYLVGGMDELKPATQRDYAKIIVRLMQTFGNVGIGQLKPHRIAMWLEERRKAGRGKTRVNREFAVLSSVHRFAMRHGWVDVNPCHGVSRNKEKPRKRYVTTPELQDALDRSPPEFQDLVAAGYLTGARQTDVIAWTRANVTPEGVHYVESKTGKQRTVAWSPLLKSVFERALNRYPEGERVFLNQQGRPWSVWAINSQKRRLKLSWAFKDLRSKAQTDSPHSILGHGAALEAVYRKVLKSKPVH